MKNLMLKRKGDLSALKEVYALENMIFKKESWIIDMLKIELLFYNNSEIPIIEQNGLILSHPFFRKLLIECHILNLGVFSIRQKDGIGGILLKDFLDDFKSISSVFLEVKKDNFSAINLYKNMG
tara:strand:- start:131 stop:502 length:372 start_codon:yes stop_codon:yes gene_type:complete